MLEGFETINLAVGSPYMSVTKNGITFNKASIVKLGKPSHVKLLMNKKDKLIAIQPCSKDDQDATSFFKPKKSGLVTVRWNNGELINTVARLMSWDLEENVRRIDGMYWEEDNAMVFDLKQARNSSAEDSE